MCVFVRLCVCAFVRLCARVCIMLRLGLECRSPHLSCRVFDSFVALYNNSWRTYLLLLGYSRTTCIHIHLDVVPAKRANEKWHTRCMSANPHRQDSVNRGPPAASRVQVLTR